MTDPALALSLFSTPVTMFDLPGMADANREIAARLLEEERTVRGVERANVGGWHSMPDLAHRTEPCFRALMQAIVNHVGQVMTVLARDAGIGSPPAFRYGLSAWGMVLRDGHYVTTHDHGDAHWSSAYYVDAGDDAPAPSGRLAFLDPRRSARAQAELEVFPSTFELAPRTGALVIFPGWLQHFVHPYRGTRPRICVSCNVVTSRGP